VTTVALPLGLRFRPFVLLGWALAGLGGLFLALAARVFPSSPGFGFDLDCYVGGAARLATGGPLYLPRLVEAPFTHGGPDVYVYAPPFAVALLPVAGLPFEQLAVAWLALRIGLLVATCALLPLPVYQRAAAFGVMAFSLSTLIDLNLGNVSLVVLVLLVIAWRLRDRVGGGAALALAAALRPTAALLVGWALLAHRRRFLAGAIVMAAALGLATLPFVGVEGWSDYLRVLRNVQAGGHERNGALESVALGLGLAAPAPALFHLAGVALGLGAVIAAARRRDEELAFVVTLMASQLVTPLLWEHYLVTLLIPAAFLATRGRAWALCLPLLAWLPHGALALAALAGLLLPFLGRPSSRDLLPRPSRLVLPAPLR
jgi:hypothetical protein